jgi:biopolymer transport protein ExbD
MHLTAHLLWTLALASVSPDDGAVDVDPWTVCHQSLKVHESRKDDRKAFDDAVMKCSRLFEEAECRAGWDQASKTTVYKDRIPQVVLPCAHAYCAKLQPSAPPLCKVDLKPLSNEVLLTHWNELVRAVFAQDLAKNQAEVFATSFTSVLRGWASEPAPVARSCPRTIRLESQKDGTVFQILDEQAKVLFTKKAVRTLSEDAEKATREIVLLELKVADKPAPCVRIQADKQVPFKLVKQVMALTKDAGVKDLDFDVLGS